MCGHRLHARKRPASERWSLNCWCNLGLTYAIGEEGLTITTIDVAEQFHPFTKVHDLKDLLGEYRGWSLPYDDQLFSIHDPAEGYYMPSSLLDSDNDASTPGGGGMF